MAIPLSATLSLQDNMSATFNKVSHAANESTKSLAYVKSATDALVNSTDNVSNSTTVWTSKLGNYSQAAMEMLYTEEELIAMGYKVEVAMDNVTNSLEEMESTANNGALDEAKNKQEQWKHEVEETNNAYVKLGGLVKKIVGIYSIGQLVSLSDQMVQTNARLGLITDNVDELGNRIYASAQRSRVSYMDMAENVAKLGMQAKEAFTNIDGSLNTGELVAFNEALNKIFTVSGMDASSISSVMYNLTQSMSTGHLLGNDYRILKMNSPEIIRILKETYADGSQEALDKMVSNGQISAQMLKNAVLGNVDEINEKFEKMPMTWGQVWTKICNTVIKASQPLLKLINEIANHWEVIGPIVYGIAAAVGAYTVALLINNAVQGVHKAITVMSTIASVAHGAAITAEMTATTGMTGAQLAFNAALYACPLTWIILAIIAVIALIYAAVAAVNEIMDTTISATGIIFGSIFVGAANIYNMVIRPLWNIIAAFVNFIANAFTHPIESVEILFLDLKKVVIGVLNSIAEYIDFLFGSNFSATTSSWLSSIEAEKEKIKAESGYEEVMGELGEWHVQDAFNSGYAFGESLEKSIGDAFDGTLDDYTGSDGSGGNALKTTTGDSLLDEDDTELLLRIATRDYKLNYQQITPEITMNFGDIRETADIDDITNALANKLEEIYSSNLEVAM